MRLEIVFKINCLSNLILKSNRALGQRLFYITTNYGTNENMRRRHRLKKFEDPVLNFN